MGAVSILAAGEWYDDGPPGDSPVSNPWLARAVGASLVLHGVAFAGLASVTFYSRSPDIRPESLHDQSMTITLVAPDRKTPIPDATEGTAAIPDVTSTGEEDVGESVARQVVAPPSRTIVEEAVPEGRDTSEAVTEPLSGADRAATLAMVSAGISRYIDTRRGETTREYVENCIRFRNRYGPNADCPETIPEGYQAIEPERQMAKEIFAVVTRDADFARMRNDLARENEYLKELMEAGGLLGEQAEIRWQLNRQYHAYLDGNILPELTFRAQTAFGNDYGRTTVPAPYQFSCGIMTACVYEFTGFTVKRPANYVEKVSSFVERTPLFMPSEN